MNGLAICAGVGGIELGLKLAEPEYRTVCYIERELYPVAATIKKMGQGLMDEAPIWDDLRTFDGEPWRGKVDIISGGFPCQPWSTAGNQKGTEDERWLWEDIERILYEVRPKYIFLENVPGLISEGGLSHILKSLALGGYDAVWNVFSAGGLGANHLRKRVFILGVANSNSTSRELSFGRVQKQESGRSSTDVSNTRSGERNGLSSIGGKEISEIGGSSKELAIAKNKGIVSGVRPQTDAERQIRGKRGNGDIQWWKVEPHVGRLVDGVPDRVDRIRANGNGVVPLVAAYAYTYLKRIIEKDKIIV